MSFWIITGLLALLGAATLIVAMRRGAQGVMPAAAYDLQVYRDQLAGVDRDLARGVINADDADRARNEISRRILAADAALQRETAQGGGSKRSAVVAALIAVVLVGGSFGLYAQLGAPGYGDFGLEARKQLAQEAYENRPSQSVAESSLPDDGDLPPNQLPAEHLELIEKLRETVAERPDDLQGHELLAREEARLGNFRAAYAVQELVLDLKGEDSDAQDYALMATMMALAAGEYVSPQAEVYVREALARDPHNPLARYYLGLLMAQTGRPDRAFGMWRVLLDEGPDNAPWIYAIRQQIEEVALRAGVNYMLPDANQPVAPVAGLSGPSAEDMEAAQDMTPEERMDMIRGMVDGLMDRLATEGGAPEEWARLIGALGVLGDTTRAQAIYNEALTVFAGNDAGLSLIRAAGEQAGLEG